jgi:hypothetical protein
LLGVCVRGHPLVLHVTLLTGPPPAHVTIHDLFVGTGKHENSGEKALRDGGGGGLPLPDARGAYPLYSIVAYP